MSARASVGVPRHIAVLGAGIVGASCALALRRDGHEVTLIDRHEVGMGCSYGNAGIVQIGGVVPIASPDVLRQLPRLLTDRDSPLFIQWRYLPRLLPYLARFVAAARPRHLQRSTRALANSLAHALDAHRELALNAGAAALYREGGELYVYHTEAGYRAASAGHALRRRWGVRVEDLPVAQLRELEPDLDGAFARAVWLPDCISTVDPLALTRAVVAAFLGAGGRCARAEVREVRPGDDGLCTVLSTRGEQRFDGLVLAGGAHAKPWARAFGVDVPLDTERGYHLMLADPGVRLRRPVVIGEARIGLSSLSDGLRIAGTAELASLDAPPNYARAHRLLKLAQRALPALRADAVSPWMGHRPSTPDSLPVIGAAPAHPNVMLAFGHGHLGLTLGPLTGRVVADLIARRSTAFDVAPFAVTRFGMRPFRPLR